MTPWVSWTPHTCTLCAPSASSKRLFKAVCPVMLFPSGPALPSRGLTLPSWTPLCDQKGDWASGQWVAPGFLTSCVKAGDSGTGKDLGEQLQQEGALGGGVGSLETFLGKK